MTAHNTVCSKFSYLVQIGGNTDQKQQMFFEIGVLKKLAIFTGKDLCWSLFLIKLQGFRVATL